MVDVETIIYSAYNLVLTVAVGYIGWSFRDRDAKREKQIDGIQGDVKKMGERISQNDTKYYKDFVTKEQHDMDINAMMKKLDDIYNTLSNLNRDIGTLIGRSQKDDK